MSNFIAALPMYDWPEIRAEVDAQWTAIRDALRADGIDAPEGLVRRNADMPPIPGGIRDTLGNLLAHDPAELPPEELHLPTLWRHPQLLLGQTCWGPMDAILLRLAVDVVGQPDYSDVEGGEAAGYSSAIVMRRAGRGQVLPPADGTALLPLLAMRDAKFGFNDRHSWSGRLGLAGDLLKAGASFGLFAGEIETGGHRLSIRAVADGRADVAAIDCRSWALARRFEPAAAVLEVVGWTSRRAGLPFISARGLHALHPRVGAAARRALRMFEPDAESA